MSSKTAVSNPVETGFLSEHEILLDAEEVGKILRVPRSWVYSHLSELPVIRLGRYRRFRRSAIERFLEERTGAC